MLVTLPTWYGTFQTHAVKPGSENVIAEAQNRYDRRMTATTAIATVIGVVLAFGGIIFVSLSANADTIAGRQLMVFGSIGFIVLGAAVALIVYFVTRAFQRDGIVERAKGHTIEAGYLDTIYQSGLATDEQEWQAAQLAEKARKLTDERFALERQADELRNVLLTPARRAEASELERRAEVARKAASKSLRQAAKLLDPPVRRRTKKRAVVG